MHDPRDDEDEDINLRIAEVLNDLEDRGIDETEQVFILFGAATLLIAQAADARHDVKRIMMKITKTLIQSGQRFYDEKHPHQRQ